MKKLLFATCFILAFAACKKEKNNPPPDNPYGLPNATTEGKNIFACRVNGENWIVQNSIYTLGGGVQNDTLSVSGSSDGNNYFHRLTLYISENIVSGNSYNINSFNRILLSANWTPCNGAMGSNVINQFATSGQIILTKYDADNKIISGKFSCRIPIPNCDTLNITDGRFDIRYY